MWKYCQTPIPGQTWELTLLSRGKNKNKNKNPHLNSARWACPRVIKFCVRPSVTKRIRLHPLQKFWYPPFTPTIICFEVKFTSLLEGVAKENLRNCVRKCGHVNFVDICYIQAITDPLMMEWGWMGISFKQSIISRYQ